MAVHGSLFQNSDQFDCLWIPASLFKIRANLAVYGSLGELYFHKWRKRTEKCLISLLDSDQWRNKTISCSVSTFDQKMSHFGT